MSSLVTVKGEVNGDLQSGVPVPVIIYAGQDQLQLPATAVVTSVKSTLEGSNGVTSGVNLSLGYSGNIGAIINGTLSSSTLMSNGCVVHANSGVLVGNASAESLYAQASAGLVGDKIIFEINYYTDDSANNNNSAANTALPRSVPSLSRSWFGFGKNK